jgi:hypothetical protein
LGLTVYGDSTVDSDQYWIVSLNGEYANITSYAKGLSLAASWSSVYTTDIASPFVLMSNEVEMYFELYHYNLVEQNTTLLTDFMQYLDHSMCSDFIINVDLAVNFTHNASFIGGDGVYQPILYQTFGSKLPVLDSTSTFMNLSDYQ